MQLGVTFPQLEIGTDPGMLREYAQTAQDVGYDYLLAYDHVIGAETTNRPGWKGYTANDQFHEPFVLFGFLAGVAPKLAYVPGIIILPQRQTVLVAKQAAEVDVLTGGTFRLGIGVGWNPVEYEALGEDFTTRGRRVEEQMEVLRLLWTQPVVTFEGKYHRITEAGLNPLPVQRPIPIWIGGMAEVALERTARLADGWFPLGRLDEAMSEKIAFLRAATEAAGRPRDAVGIDARIDVRTIPEAEWAQEAEKWRAAGATHLSVNTMGAGLASPRDHIATIRRFKEAVE
ncbi:MAG TPA: LLM class F420-dependent oxidoreductase [Thermomicrobiales bacterium]|jgi:probable F420-dependent oxidoreductase